MKRQNCFSRWCTVRFINRTITTASLSVLVLLLVATPIFAQGNHAVDMTAGANSMENTTDKAPPQVITADETLDPEYALNSEQNLSNSPSQASSERADLALRELTLGDRARIYRRSVFSPLTFIGPTLGAGIGLWENEPAEWGQGMAGYGRRFGSSMGRTLSNKTMVFGIAAMDGEDPRYIPSEQSGLLARSRYAVVSTFVSRRGDGSRMPAISLLAGAYGSAFIANTWYPPAKSTTRHALEQGSSKLLSTVGLHLLHEFWPDIKQKLHLHR